MQFYAELNDNVLKMQIGLQPDIAGAQDILGIFIQGAAPGVCIIFGFSQKEGFLFAIVLSQSNEC